MTKVLALVATMLVLTAGSHAQTPGEARRALEARGIAFTDEAFLDAVAWWGRSAKMLDLVSEDAGVFHSDLIFYGAFLKRLQLFSEGTHFEYFY